MFYHASKVPEDKEMGDRFVLILDDSSWAEDLTGDWLQKTAYKLHSQQMKVDIDGIGSGSIDGVITDMMGNDFLYEHKGLSHFSFERYWVAKVWPIDYITQCILYLTGLQKINPSINKAVLLIKNKNSSAYMDFVIAYNKDTDTAIVESMAHSKGEFKIATKEEPLLTIPNITKDAIAKFDLVDEHVKNKTLPPRPFEIGTTFPCGYCSWETTCFSGYEKEYKKLETSAVLDQEVEDLCRLYLENDMHQKAMKKECDAQKQDIKDILKEKGVVKGRAGCYTLHINLQNKTKLDRELIPADILKMATVKCQSEMFTIRKPKVKKGRKQL